MNMIFTLALSIVIGMSITSRTLTQDRGSNIKHGQSIYEQYCQRCHGQKGDGNGPDVQYLIVPPANFLSPASRSKTDLELLTTITFGVIFSPMHGWRGRLTDEDMWDVIGYIRFLAPFKAIAEVETLFAQLEKDIGCDQVTWPFWSYRVKTGLPSFNKRGLVRGTSCLSLRVRDGNPSGWRSSAARCLQPLSLRSKAGCA